MEEHKFDSADALGAMQRLIEASMVTGKQRPDTRALDAINAQGIALLTGLYGNPGRHRSMRQKGAEFAKHGFPASVLAADRLVTTYHAAWSAIFLGSGAKRAIDAFRTEYSRATARGALYPALAIAIWDERDVAVGKCADDFRAAIFFGDDDRKALEAARATLRAALFPGTVTPLRVDDLQERLRRLEMPAERKAAARFVECYRKGDIAGLREEMKRAGGDDDYPVVALAIWA